MKPVLIAPADSPAMLEAVLDRGAGMAFAGISRFCRHEKSSVDFAAFSQMAGAARARGKSLAAAINLVPPVGEIPSFVDAAGRALELGAGGLIVNDPGLVRLLRRVYPAAYIMASVGMSPLNHREVSFLVAAGASTVLVSEFLTPGEGREIKMATGASLEAMASGLREYGYTGRCILSSYHCQHYRDGRPAGSGKRGGACGSACRQAFRLAGGASGKGFALPLCPFLPGDGLEDVLEWADVIKLSRGSLKREEFLDIIGLVAAKIEQWRQGKPPMEGERHG